MIVERIVTDLQMIGRQLPNTRLLKAARGKNMTKINYLFRWLCRQFVTGVPGVQNGSCVEPCEELRASPLARFISSVELAIKQISFLGADGWAQPEKILLVPIHHHNRPDIPRNRRKSSC